MLLLDDREDTILYEALARTFDVRIVRQRLEYGDALWEGNGPDGPVTVAVERKHIKDVADSMINGRLAGHQLRGMTQHYDYIYLCVEDIWQPGARGELEIWRNGKWTPLWSSTRESCGYRQVQAFLNGLAVAAGVMLLRTNSPRETAALYVALYHWWQKKWQEHKTVEEIYAPGPEVERRRGKASLITREAGLTEKLISQLPGIDKKAWDVGQGFGSAREFLEFAAFSGAREWQQLRGIAREGAEQIVAALDERRG